MWFEKHFQTAAACDDRASPEPEFGSPLKPETPRRVDPWTGPTFFLSQDPLLHCEVALIPVASGESRRRGQKGAECPACGPGGGAPEAEPHRELCPHDFPHK